MESSTSSPPPKQETQFHLTIRFATSLPDLQLDIAHPSRTTVVSLKHLIRASLPLDFSTNRLRLIYSGRLLQDASTINTVLKPPPPPPPPDRKGKAPALPPQRIYINCSIGDSLSAAELTEEANSASAPSPLPTTAAAASTAPQPRGFDRLLTASFTPAEVNALRVQFLALQSSTHTPDTMPSPTTLRRMEDAWLDDNGSGGGGAAEEEARAGSLDDLLWGHVIGFLWPLGALGWLGREESVWSESRRTAVWCGVLLGMGFGLMRIMA